MVGIAPSLLKSKASFQKMIPSKTKKKIETAINTCVSLKATLEKDDFPQKRDFLTWSIEHLIRKVKQFVKKYIA